MNKTKRRVRSTALALSTIVSFAAFAQGQYGAQSAPDGARQLGADEVRSAIVGSTVIFSSAAGSRVRRTFDKDGSISGSYVQANGRDVSESGTWSLNDSGAMCGEVFSKRATAQNPFCVTVHRAGDRLFFHYPQANRWVAFQTE